MVWIKIFMRRQDMAIFLLEYFSAAFCKCFFWSEAIKTDHYGVQVLRVNYSPFFPQVFLQTCNLFLTIFCMSVAAVVCRRRLLCAFKNWTRSFWVSIFLVVDDDEDCRRTRCTTSELGYFPSSMTFCSSRWPFEMTTFTLLTTVRAERVNSFFTVIKRANQLIGMRSTGGLTLLWCPY